MCPLRSGEAPGEAPGEVAVADAAAVVGELKKGLRENLDVELGLAAGDVADAADLGDEDEPVVVGPGRCLGSKIDRPHRLQPISPEAAPAYALLLAISVARPTGSMIKSPAMMAEATLRRLK